MTDKAKTYTAAEVRELARRACQTAGGQAAWARNIGVSRQYVHQVVSGDAPPGVIIMKALGMSTAGITPHSRHQKRKFVQFVLDAGLKDA